MEGGWRGGEGKAVRGRGRADRGRREYMKKKGRKRRQGKREDKKLAGRGKRGQEERKNEAEERGTGRVAEEWRTERRGGNFYQVREMEREVTARGSGREARR